MTWFEIFSAFAVFLIGAGLYLFLTRRLRRPSPKEDKTSTTSRAALPAANLLALLGVVVALVLVALAVGAALPALVVALVPPRRAPETMIGGGIDHDEGVRSRPVPCRDETAAIHPHNVEENVALSTTALPAWDINLAGFIDVTEDVFVGHPDWNECAMVLDVEYHVEPIESELTQPTRHKRRVRMTLSGRTTDVGENCLAGQTPEVNVEIGTHDVESTPEVVEVLDVHSSSKLSKVPPAEEGSSRPAGTWSYLRTENVGKASAVSQIAFRPSSKGDFSVLLEFILDSAAVPKPWAAVYFSGPDFGEESSLPSIRGHVSWPYAVGENLRFVSIDLEGSSNNIRQDPDYRMFRYSETPMPAIIESVTISEDHRRIDFSIRSQRRGSAIIFFVDRPLEITDEEPDQDNVLDAGAWRDDHENAINDAVSG